MLMIIMKFGGFAGNGAGSVRKMCCGMKMQNGHPGGFCYPERTGSAEKKRRADGRRFLPLEGVGCIIERRGFAEPDSGVDAAGMTGRIRPGERFRRRR